MNRILIIFIVLPYLSFSQNSGVHFMNGITWEQVKEKALAENKLIFVDCYATWCGPCKFMDKNIFTTENVGELMNNKFISFRLQMDSVKNDPPEIRKMYGTANDFKKIFKIESYPTYLIFSPSGVAVNKFTGSSSTSGDFVFRISNALKPEVQYFILMAGWRDHIRDSSYLLHCLQASKEADDRSDSVKSVLSHYISFLKSPLKFEDILLVYDLTEAESDTGFQFYLANAPEIDRIVAEKTGHKNYVESEVSGMIFQDEILPNIDNQSTVKWNEIISSYQKKYNMLESNPLAIYIESEMKNYIRVQIEKMIGNDEMESQDWRGISIHLKQRFPDFDIPFLLDTEEAKYYYESGNWDKYSTIIFDISNKYSTEIITPIVNDGCWKIFLNSNNRNTLEVATRTMEKIVNCISVTEGVFYYDCLDTYANLLYKAGFKEKAIVKEKMLIDKALSEKSMQANMNVWEGNLKKMQSGLPTWSN